MLANELVELIGAGLATERRGASWCPATEASERVCGSPKQADARSLSDDGSGMQVAGKVATLERSYSAAEPPAQAAATCASAAALSAATAGLGHVDPDRLRHDRGIVRHVIFVPEQELKRMPPW
jgi:hypothetical protein